MTLCSTIKGQPLELPHRVICSIIVPAELMILSGTLKDHNGWVPPGSYALQTNTHCSNYRLRPPVKWDFNGSFRGKNVSLSEQDSKCFSSPGRRNSRMPLSKKQLKWKNTFKTKHKGINPSSTMSKFTSEVKCSEYTKFQQPLPFSYSTSLPPTSTALLAS